MMQIILPKSWKEDFAAAVAAKREDLRWKEKLAVNEAREKQRAAEEKAEEARKDAATYELIAFALATPHEVAAFRVTLDEYDTATIELLMDNERALNLVRQRIDTMLEEAHVLPDGRRVFKTKDGERVFDEYGAEISRDVLDPDIIDDRKTKWETFEEAKNEHRRLTEERQQLSEYQQKLDEARARLNEGQITKQELEEIKADLAASMPDAVREKLGLEKPAVENDKMRDKPEQETGAERSAPARDMDRLMADTALGPSAGPAMR